MATNAATAGRYPDLPVHELTSEHGTAGSFTGRITAEGLACSTCGASDTVTVYQGPQHGPETVEVEFTWCTGHGLVAMRLLNQDDTEHHGL